MVPPGLAPTRGTAPLRSGPRRRTTLHYLPSCISDSPSTLATRTDAAPSIDTSAAIMAHIPTRLSSPPALVAPTHRVCSATGATAISLDYNINPQDMAQVYISPSPYNDAFDEVLDLRKFNIDKHRAAIMSFITQDGRLILGTMVPSTPGARVPRWRISTICAT
jgi:hypothetical protein